MTSTAHFLRRLACGIVITSACTAAFAAAPSACPPVIGEKAMMLSALQTIGTNRRMAELCGIPARTIQKRVAEEVRALKPCLDERGILQAEIEATIRAGEPAGQEIIDHPGPREQRCEKVREGY